MSIKNKPCQSEKKAYTQPKLIIYGAVRYLTNASSSGPNEMSTGNNNGKVRPSDPVTKENMVRIGLHPLGINLYLFNYKSDFRDDWGHSRQFGVMADEVEKVMPKAVSRHPEGYKMVNYAMLGIIQASH